MTSLIGNYRIPHGTIQLGLNSGECYYKMKGGYRDYDAGGDKCSHNTTPSQPVPYNPVEYYRKDNNEMVLTTKEREEGQRRMEEFQKQRQLETQLNLLKEAKEALRIQEERLKRGCLN